MKTCSKCKIEKELIEFYKNKTKKFGVGSWCRVCIKEYSKNNKDSINEYFKEYYKKNKDSMIESMKKYQERNKEYIFNYRKSDKYKASHKKGVEKHQKSDKYKAAQERRANAILRQSPPWLTDAEHAQMNKMYIGKPSTMAVDHIIPIQGIDVSGLNVPWNLQYLPKKQNTFKGRKFDFTNTNESWKLEYVKYHGSLDEDEDI